MTDSSLQGKTDLASLRDKIDGIDRDIGKLISERALCAAEVARVKQAQSAQTGEPIVFYRPEREAQVLRQAIARNEGPLSDEIYARLFREIMSACLALEDPVTVAYLGPEGTFTQQAALKHFGIFAKAQSMSAIDEVFREVASQSVDYGVVPVENSTEGVVTHTLDNFLSQAGRSVKICGEVVLRIHHHLLISDVTNTKSITRIYSHSQSLAQCRKWLDAKYPKADRIAVSSNAEAARRVKSEWNAAAIAGSMAADIYGLESFAQNIEDRPDNSTRFLIIGTDDVKPSGNDKTSLVISMHNEPGALHHALEPFRQHGIDLTRIETRPSPSGTWNYVFFIDCMGHVSEDKIQSAIAEVKRTASDLKVLGSYPIGVL